MLDKNRAIFELDGGVEGYGEDNAAHERRDGRAELLVVENCQYTRGIGIHKRDGWAEATTLSEDDDWWPHTLAVGGRGAEILGAATAAKQLSEFDNTQDDDTYLRADIATVPATSEAGAIGGYDVAYYNDGTWGYYCYVSISTETSIPSIRVVEEDSGTTVYEEELSITGVVIKVVTVGDSFLVFCTDSGGGTLEAYRVDMSSQPTSSSNAEVSSVIKSDFGLCTDGTVAYVVYQNTSDDDIIFADISEDLATINYSGSLITASGTLGAFSLAYDATNDKLLGSLTTSPTSTGTWALISCDSDYSNPQGMTTLGASRYVDTTTVVPYSGTYWFVAYSGRQSGTKQSDITEYVRVNTSHSTGTVQSLEGVALMSQAYRVSCGDSNHDDEYRVLAHARYCHLYGSTSTQTYDTTPYTHLENGLLLMFPMSDQDSRFNTHTRACPVAVSSFNNATWYRFGYSQGRARHLPHVVEAAAGSHTTLLCIVQEVAKQEGTGQSLQALEGLNRVTASHFPPTAAAPIPLGRATLGDATVLGGGLATSFDGRYLNEYALPHKPPRPLAAADAGSGSGPTAGTYNFRVVYGFIDNHGLVHRTLPSDALSWTQPGTNDIDLTIATNLYSLHDRFSNNGWFVEVYQTEDGGATYYLVASEELSSNSTSGSPLTIRLGVSDAVLITNKPLYTTGNVLADYAPPPLYAVASSETRLWGISAQDRRAYYFTKEAVEGFAPGWHPTLRGRLEAAGGDLTAIVVMDDKTLLFQEEAIYAIYGDGPTALGTGAFSVPQRVVDGLGTTQREGVVVTPHGVVFLSNAGFKLLTRGLELVDLHSAIEHYFDSDSDIPTNVVPTTVRRAVHDKDEEQVLFFMDDDTNGSYLVWDYSDIDLRSGSTGRWFVNYYADTAIRDAGFATVAGSYNLVLLTATGTRGRTPNISGASRDNGQDFVQKVGGKWFMPAGQGSRMRVWGLTLSGVVPQVPLTTLSLDYYRQGRGVDPTAAQSQDFVLASYDDLEPPNNLRFRPKNQRCGACRWVLTATTTFGGGFVLYSYRYDYGVYPRAAGTVGNHSS